MTSIDENSYRKDNVHNQNMCYINLQNTSAIPSSVGPILQTFIHTSYDTPHQIHQFWFIMAEETRKAPFVPLPRILLSQFANALRQDHNIEL